jgi:hypothetical protein
VLYEECELDSRLKRLQRPFKRLVALEADNDPAASDYVARLFLKSQHVTKAGALPKPDEFGIQSSPVTKPAQAIVAFLEHVASVMGPWTRYLDRALQRVSKAPTLYYGGVSPYKFNRWVRRNFPKVIKCLANDYTRYDLSCNAETLAFEIIMMRVFSVPEWVIDFHYRLVTSLQVSKFLLGIMRNSGQWCTYLFNTWFNEAVSCCMYLMHGFSACYSGDDMLIFGVPAPNPLWLRIQRWFRLVAKVVISDVPEFCSWVLHPEGIFRDPLMMLIKLRYHAAAGRLSRVALSYLLEFQSIRIMEDVLLSLNPNFSAACSEIIALFQTHRRFIPIPFRPFIAHARPEYAIKIDLSDASRSTRRYVGGLRSMTAHGISL